MNNKRSLQLDVLRGVAILLVMGRHLQLPRPGGVVGGFAEAWYRIGWLGVDLFFVLSGFLIGGLLLLEMGKRGTIDVPRFLIRRGLKIYPPYFVFIAYVMLMPAAKAFVGGGDAWATLGAGWKTHWPNLLFLQNYVGANPEGHTWTLAVEEHFYLMLPFVLVALASRGRLRWLMPLCLAMVPACLALRCLSVLAHDSYAVKMSATHLRLDALLVGVAVRGVAELQAERFMALRRWRGGLLVGGFLLWLPNLYLDPSSALVRTLGLTGTLLGSAAFLIAACHVRAGDFGRMARFVSPVAALVAWIGVYSYGIYLWHVTAIGILEREFGGRMQRMAGGVGQGTWIVSALVIGAGAIMVGVVSSRLLEWPVLRLRDRIFPSRTGSLNTAAGSGPAEPAPSRRLPVAPA